MKSGARRAWLVLVLTATALAAAHGAEAASRRYALVLGNADYAAATLPRLPDVMTAAVHMADTLSALGFDVYEGRALVNHTKKETLDFVAAFLRRAQDAEVIFVYYAGHGIQQGQRNHLIPLDARPDASGELKPTIDFEDDLLKAFEDSKAALIFVIDACRNSPGSYAPMIRPSDRVKNRIIAFPNRPGGFASTPSKYTPALIDALRQPGLRIEDVLTRARRRVAQETDDLEQPEEYGALIGAPLYLQPTRIPDGTLATIDRNTYYLVTGGRWRRIPDIGSIERLGFDISFAVKKVEEDRIRSPQGRELDYPSVDTNMLQSRTCLYYLFWGMRWCVPRGEPTAALGHFEKWRRRSLTTTESLGIPAGSVRRLPDGLVLKFGNSPDVFEINSGVLTKAVARDRRPIWLPAFMRPSLSSAASINTNQLANSQLIADSARKRVYVIHDGVVILADVTPPGKAISIRGLAPAFIALAPKKGHLFVADSTGNVIHRLDVMTGKTVGTLKQVFETPTPFTGMVVTPDEKRLYVGNQGGDGVLSAGNIVVYDLAGTAAPTSIGGVACPEHMSTTADGEHVYLASQCGGGKDALFVIDTNLDVARGVAPDLAVGRVAAVVPDGSKVYVSRGEPERITVIAPLAAENLGSVWVDARSMAVAPDGSAIAVLSSTHRNRLSLIDTSTDHVTSVIFESGVQAVTIGESNGNMMVIAWLPEREKPIYFQSVAGLVAGAR